jgi:ABC-type polysaccharide/polyol phosphate transport system ATPase subunit
MSDAVIRLNNIGKMYRLYRRPVDKVLDALGVNRLLFWRRDYYRSFWALRGLNLEIGRGERVGLIGRNGAGKSTLLRIIANAALPTEGERSVQGRIQALMQLGTGFHPEFTGFQNIRAALSYHGLSETLISPLVDDIVDFAELREFIDQPVRTYSAGMYARLAFAVATSVEPEILIIDEILGAGDAYFYGKCVERMRRLTANNRTTVLFVSHDLSSVLALCNRAVWINGGRIVADGPPLDVTQAYYAEIQREENARLQAAAQKGLPADPEPAGGLRLFEAEAEAVPQENKSVVTWARPDPRIEAVRFVDPSGRGVTGIEEESELTIEMHYFSSAVVKDPVFAFSLFLPDGTRVCHANTVLGGNPIAEIHGRGVVRFRFSPFLAGPGDYILGCSIFKHFDPSQNVQPPYYDQHDRTHRFRVWKKLGVAMNLGLVKIPYRVEHRPQADATAPIAKVI